MSEPPLKKKRSTILDFFQRMSQRNKTSQADEGKDDSKGNQEANMADTDTSETDMKRKKQQGSVSGIGKGKNVNENSESHAAKHSQGNKTNQAGEGKDDSKGTQEVKMADTDTSETDMKRKKQQGSVSGTGKGKNVNKNSESHAAKHSQGNKTNQAGEGNDDSKGTQEAKMADTDTGETDMKRKEQGSVSGIGKDKNVNKNSESHAAKHSQAKSSTESRTTVETDESSPGPDDDTCEQESEDCPAILNSESTDDLLSSYHVIPNKKPSPKKDGSQAWKGTPVNVMKKLPACEEKLGPLKNSDSHVVLFHTPYEYKEESPFPPKPYPQYRDKWDHYHVRMPCSNQNEFPVQEKHGKKIARRWDIITRVLSQDIKDVNDLEAAIGSYNHRYFDKWDFETLHYFFTRDLNEEEQHNFFSKTMKKMQRLALNLPDLCSCPIPLLKKGQSKSVTFSQQQIASLLANAFFCTFPQRNTKQHFSEFSKFPSINFSSLFTGKPDSVKMEKLRCIQHYFTRICDKTPCGTVTITRLHKSDFPDWDEMETLLSGLHVSSEGTIEDDGEGMLQVDFANKFLGGGVLSHGCVQEEIRFLICPEMIISRLITEELNYNEALVMRGCERFSDYDGYSSTFKWKGSYTDKTARDKWGRIYCEVVAIDALIFRNYKSQFQHDTVLRELNKAYCGFFRRLPKEHLPASVCTGNWGCGAFGGDRRLKALIQLMAAAQAKRDVCYFTFDDEKLRDDLHQIHSYLTVTNPLSIGDLLKIIEQYRKNVILKSQRKPEMNIFEFILRTFDGSLENTDEDSQSSNEMRFQKESGSESSSSSMGATDGVTVNVDWESETNTSSSQSTSKISTSRQNSQEAQSSK